MPGKSTISAVSTRMLQPTRSQSKALWLGVAIYWIAMFAGSHAPPSPDPPTASSPDKLIHFGAFAGLSFLLLVAVAATRKVSLRAILVLALLVIVYGALDELTQPIVGRTCDLFDLVADALGLMAGVVCFLVLRAILTAR